MVVPYNTANSKLLQQPVEPADVLPCRMKQQSNNYGNLPSNNALLSTTKFTHASLAARIAHVPAKGYTTCNFSIAISIQVCNPARRHSLKTSLHTALLGYPTLHSDR